MFKVIMDLILCNDIQFEIISYLNKIGLIMLYYTNKNYYYWCSQYGRQNKIPRVLENYKIAQEGHLNILIWLNEKYDDMDFNYACYSGNLEMLEWLYKKACLWSSYAYLYAIIGNHLAVLEWLIKKKCPRDQWYPAYPLDKLNILQKIQFYWNPKKETHREKHLIEILTLRKINEYSIGDLICQFGNIEIFEWSRANNLFCSTHGCSIAARYGHLNLIKWMRKNGMLIRRTDICCYAAYYGHINILQWANKEGWKTRPEICRFAAEGGQLKTLQWLRENDYTWSADVCTEAAYYGHLDILQWAYQNGCPINEKVLLEAAESGEFEIFEWAYKNDFPWNRNLAFLSPEAEEIINNIISKCNSEKID